MNGDLSPREKAKDLASKKSAEDRISPRSDASSHGSSTSTKHRDVRCLFFSFFFTLSLFLLLLITFVAGGNNYRLKKIQQGNSCCHFMC